ncbi:hypothetical protein NQ176_g3948 [Zarea fungicola]|uniref:Uncharacterized protein n=1 Tax=Zarea fungicola TaxID=93591 RepID=A0ACC1NIE8_9HYPO|nr:hypothetical protein NQ176_g3948 [Lecanicillium fungicola]
MQFKSISFAALAMSASGALAAQPEVSAAQSLQLLDTLVDTLNAAGDVRIQLQKDTPTLNAKNVVAFDKSLQAALAKVSDAFPQNTGDISIAPFTDEQKSALCAALPKITDAGRYATDTLTALPTFHDNNDAFNADFDLGLEANRLATAFNMLYWSFHDSGSATKCDRDAQAALEGINHVLQEFGDSRIY